MKTKRRPHRSAPNNNNEKLNENLCVTAVIKVGAAVFCLDVGLELLRLGEIFAAQMALRSASVRIGRTAVGPVNIQVSWSQKTLRNEFLKKLYGHESMVR